MISSLFNLAENSYASDLLVKLELVELLDGDMMDQGALF